MSLPNSHAEMSMHPEYLKAQPTMQEKMNGLHRKLSSHSSSKQTSTFHRMEGTQDEGSRDMENAESGWRPIRISPSPFETCADLTGVQTNARAGVHFLDSPPASGSDDEQRFVRQKSGSNLVSAPERTKSRMLSDIADQVSRNQYMRSGHTRRSSGDSQDSSRDPLRRARKRRWQLTKAFSAPGEDVYDAMSTMPWQTNSPSESRNWATEIYQEERPSHPNQVAKSRPDFSALRGRTTGRKRYSGRYRTSKFIGVGSSNRKTQWQARILVQGKVTHLGYYASEEEAARVYDRVALSLNPCAQTNFPASHYPKGSAAQFSGLGREDLQRALGVKPMDKSSRFRGVSRKKGKWEAKVMVNRKWAYRALFDSEDEAAHAYDAAVWRLKPKEATSFVNFKDGKSVRESPKQSPKGSPSPTEAEVFQRRSEDSPVKLEQAEKVGSHEAATLSEMHIPDKDCVQHDLPLPEPVEYFVSEPLRTQSVQLPVFGSDLGRTDSGMPLISALTQAPSLPSDLGLTASGSAMDLPSISLSPQRSMCNQNCLPSLPPLPLPPLAVVSRMDLPDPNSIGVPPPGNLPFPELVTGRSAEAVSTLAPQSRASTPTQAGHSSMYSTQHNLSPVRAVSGGLPPLPGRSSTQGMEGGRYIANIQGLHTATPQSPYTEIRADSHLLTNPFYDAACQSISNGPANTATRSSYDNQPSGTGSVDTLGHLQQAHTEGYLRSSSLVKELPYTGSLEPVRYTAHLPNTASLVSINSALYASPSGPPVSTGGDTLGEIYSGGNLPIVEPVLSFEQVQSLANSRSASSNFLHSIQTANSALLRSASTASGLPIYHGHELGRSPLPTLANAASIDSSFLAHHQNIMQDHLVGTKLPKFGSSLPDTRPLNAAQADLLANLDVEVELNDPVPINPVQIGGEIMNVYSADIMGNILH